jgi:hypothetical protein
MAYSKKYISEQYVVLSEIEAKSEISNFNIEFCIEIRICKKK